MGTHPREGVARSPCVSKCALGVGDFCLGCARSIQDIVGWAAMAPVARHEATKKAAARMRWSAPDGRARAIMALGPLGEAGIDGKLPWRLPSELAWFKQATAGSVLAMGRSTWEGLRRDLPGRKIAVLASAEPEGLSAIAPGARHIHDLDQAFDWAFDANVPLCVAGGPALWTSAWERIDAAWITRVQGPMSADAFFLPDLSGFELVASGPSGADGVWTWTTELWERASSR